MSGVDEVMLATVLGARERELNAILKAKRMQYLERGRGREAHGVEAARLLFIRHAIGIPTLVDKLPDTDFGELKEI